MLKAIFIMFSHFSYDQMSTKMNFIGKVLSLLPNVHSMTASSCPNLLKKSQEYTLLQHIRGKLQVKVSPHFDRVNILPQPTSN
ncbi:hypothetical protein CICLE_v10033220mg [Citrus x clementina]|uniref:Uncharacterized protein n=1 Tax=Citrus clementina TaxID=85681 RepID=V4TLR3_CITCL|nr:hypothetical protein CICLE_v10033220mg [Citrus x clementina]